VSGAVRGLEPWRWLGIPMLQVMAVSFLFALPIRIYGLALPEPIFALPVVFAWAVIRPSMLAPVCVMLTGVYLDLLWGAPTGFWAVCLLIAYGAVLAARAILAGQGRLVMWAWYAAVTGLTLGAGYMLVLVSFKGAADPGPLLWQFLVTVVLYPFADRLIDRFEDADVRFR
jgi:rod shape-determining protein MreD